MRREIFSHISRLTSKRKMKLNIKDTFNKELIADKNRNNVPRQVHEAHFSYVTPRVPSNPKLLHVSKEMLENIGLRTWTTNV